MLTDIRIEYNTVTLQNSCVGTSSLHHSDMVQFGRLRIDDELIIRNNYFWWKGTRNDGYTQGIYATSTASSNPGGLIKIYNNIFFFETTGKGAVHIANKCTVNTTIYTSNIVAKVWNNTFYVSPDWVIANATDSEPFIQFTRAGTFGNPVVKNEIKNNIIADYANRCTTTVGGTPYTNYLTTLLFSSEGVDFSSANLEIDDNLYYAPNKTENGTTDPWLVWNDDSYYTLTDFKDACLQETHGYYGDPIFGTKYTPQLPNGDSPNDFIAWNVSDSGTVLFTEGTNPPPEFLIDFNGCYRDIYWNRGAFEEGDMTGESPGMQKTNNEMKKVLLVQNYPNPFNPSTTINYFLPISGFTTLKIYDMLGNEVATLVNEDKQTGSYTVEFNASNLSSGVYFYNLTSGSFTMNKKMILMK
ncbi:MAG TPA: T9SS type A sorting domain-containing protein [Ignavibacteriaceae bacterium]|nr:T9SS type A sorting domain-containing protein [Ignavibacteriaceae bacterium]